GTADGAGRENQLPGRAEVVHAAAGDALDAYRAVVLDDDPAHLRVFHDREVRPVDHPVEESDGGTLAPAAEDRARVVADPYLIFPVQIVPPGQAEPIAGLDPGIGEWI